MLYAIIATLAISLISLIGILLLPRISQKSIWIKRFIGIAIGTLLAAVFFDLLPEAAEGFANPRTAFLIVLGSIFAFFIIEKVIHYHHCGCEDEQKGHVKQHLVVNNLIGDGIHNFIDGVIIAGAFLIDVRIGIGTAIAVALHEIPQEVSDFSILVYAGLSRKKAIFYNVLFGLTRVVGAMLVFFIADSVTNIVPVLLAIASGNFIYLAMADLIPELHHEENPERIWMQLFWILIGVALMYGVGLVVGKA
ncbi:MAG: ZIP family metal transporter [Candidatus Jacksonbacteria bacterium]|nr:ZIP family metal transporter [Candidatus Jacksonbacteria bacterium]